MGKISVEGMQFYAHHGYYKEEQILGGKYTVDVFMETDFSNAVANDSLQQTVNYEEVYALTKEEMAQPSHLIEHLCQRIHTRIRLAFPQLGSLKVKVSKHNPPLKGSVEKVSVEI